MRNSFATARQHLGAGLLCLLLAGCYEIRSDTVLHADGSLVRAVDQARAQTPSAVLALPVWKAAHFGEESGFERLETSFAEQDRIEAERAVETGAEPSERFTAWGEFANFEEIPDHYVLESADGTREARLTRRYGQNDYGFVQEYLWEETATEIVTVADMKEARRAYAEHWRRLVLAFGEEYLGADYDLAGLDEWLRNEGNEWHEAYVDLEFDHNARQARRVLDLDFGDEEAHDKAFASLCARYGLKLSNGEGNLLEGSAQEKAWLAFVRTTLLSTLRTKDGGKVDPAALEPLLLELADEDAGEDPPEGEEKEDADSPAELAWERATERVLGAGGNTEDEQETLAQRLDGLQEGSFQFTMTLPGVVVATNATLLKDNRVRWEFSGSQAFPYGFPMAVRTLAPDTALQERLGTTPLATRESLLEFVRLAAADEDLAIALRQCAKKTSAAPLKALQESILALEDEGTRKARTKSLDKVKGLLGLE